MIAIKNDDLRDSIQGSKNVWLNAENWKKERKRKKRDFRHIAIIFLFYLETLLLFSSKSHLTF